MIRPTSGYVSSRASVSNKALISPGVRIYGAAHIGSYVVLEPGVTIGHPAPIEQTNLRSYLLEQHAARVGEYDELIDDFVRNPTVVEEGAVIRSGCSIYSGSYIYSNADLGHNCMVREESVVGKDTHVLTGTQIMARVNIGGGCRVAGTLCNGTQVGNATSMLGHAMHHYKLGVPGHTEIAPNVLDGVIVGREVAVIGAVTIGNFAIIGAGAVVIKDIPEATIWAGNPARQIGSRSLRECEELVNRVKLYANFKRAYPYTTTV